MLRRPRHLGRLLLVTFALVALALAGAAYWFATPPGDFSKLECTGSGPCRAVDGRVLYVERVDPDGDDDIHLVLLDRDSLSRRYVSVLKLPDGLREDAPGFGSWVSATGPTYIGDSRRRNLRVRRLRVAR